MLFLLAGPHARGDDWHTITDANGRDIRVMLLGGDETSVSFRKNGQDFNFPLSRLSEESQAYIKEFLENKAAEEKKQATLARFNSIRYEKTEIKLNKPVLGLRALENYWKSDDILATKHDDSAYVVYELHKTILTRNNDAEQCPKEASLILDNKNESIFFVVRGWRGYEEKFFSLRDFGQQGYGKEKHIKFMIGSRSKITGQKTMQNAFGAKVAVTTYDNFDSVIRLKNPIPEADGVLSKGIKFDDDKIDFKKEADVKYLIEITRPTKVEISMDISEARFNFPHKWSKYILTAESELRSVHVIEDAENTYEHEGFIASSQQNHKVVAGVITSADSELIDQFLNGR